MTNNKLPDIVVLFFSVAIIIILATDFIADLKTIMSASTDVYSASADYEIYKSQYDYALSKGLTPVLSKWYEKIEK